MSLSAVSDSSVGADFVSRINVLGLELKVAPYLGGGRLCSKLHRGEDHRSLDPPAPHPQKRLRLREPISYGMAA